MKRAGTSIKYKKKAKGIGVIPGKMKEAELIRAIQKAEGHKPCFRKSNGRCSYTNCRFRRYCLARAKSKFNINSRRLIPTLDLEQYEPNIEPEVGVKDNIKGSTRYAWIGAGQCGGRLVKSFYDLGYRKTLAVNTTHQNMDLLEIPENQKFLMDIGEKGAGNDMEKGRGAVRQYQQEILHLTGQTFGSQIDHIIVCFGAGGGTVLEPVEVQAVEA
ncbi:MAG: hypothetical protein ACYTBX_20115 [Planctomycetota bacterium]|jgi:hypothetical protein